MPGQPWLCAGATFRHGGLSCICARWMQSGSQRGLQPRPQPGLPDMSVATAWVRVSCTARYDQAPKPAAKISAVTSAPSPRLPKDSRSPIRAATRTRSERATRETQSMADQLSGVTARPPLVDADQALGTRNADCRLRVTARAGAVIATGCGELRRAAPRSPAVFEQRP